MRAMWPRDCNKQINFNSRTKISPVDKIIEASGSGLVKGTITDIVPKSGYIERCPECKRVLVNGHCPVHVDVKPEEDMRIKASLDPNFSQDFLLNIHPGSGAK